MKKQINPSIKAHLLRSPLILLSLLAVCAMPFALAQSRSPGATEQNVVQPVANQAPAGNLYLPFSSARAPEPAEAEPAWQSRFPTKMISSAGVARLPIVPYPKAPEVVLYDQLNNPGTASTASQEFPDAPTQTVFTADDFVVPGGQTWTITEVDAEGLYGNCTTCGPADNFNVFFYRNSGGLPGTQVYSATAQSYVNNSGVFQVTLSSPAVLSSGTYWVSVQAHMSFTTNGQWFWTDRTVTSNSPAAWQNPAGGLPPPTTCPAPGCPMPCPTCISWGIRQCCAGTPAGEPDQMFRLIGTISGGTPSPTATGTPSPSATATPTSTGTPSPTPTGTPSPSPTGTPTPGSCVRYEAESSNNTLTGSAVIQSCPTCSGGQKVGYVGNNSGTLQFNGVTANVSGRYAVTISYTNGDAVRYALLSVNGSQGTPVSFPSTGSFQTVGSKQITVTLNAGNNTLEFYNPIVGSWAPDFDRLGVNCAIQPTPTPTPAATTTASATATATASPTATATPSGTPGAARAVVADFNGDHHPDWVIRNAGTRQTAIWYMNNNVFIAGAFGPTLAAGWGLRGAADFNSNGHPDYSLFAPSTLQTAIWYLSGPTFIGAAYGPTLPGGWTLAIIADFNGNLKPDYVLYNAGTRQTAIWYMNNNVFVSGAYGPTLPAGSSLVGAADFNRDGHPDYALVNSTTGQTAIWYLSGPTFIGAANGPIVPTGWAFVATADFNGDLKPDYLLYNAGTRQTAIWYMNNNVFVSAAYGPTLQAGWSLVGQ